MPKTHAIVLSRAAREAGVPLNELHDAALAAATDIEPADIWFRAFRVRGRQFALSTRLVIEVDSFPHRAPTAALLPPAQPNRYVQKKR